MNQTQDLKFLGRGRKDIAVFAKMQPKGDRQYWFGGASTAPAARNILLPNINTKCPLPEEYGLVSVN